MPRSSPFRKSDLKPAFAAAKEAGYDEVRVEVETPDGMRFQITAGKSGEGPEPDLTPLEKWRADHAS